MGKYRKKPIVIEAVHYHGIVNPAGEVAFSDIPDWLDDALKAPKGTAGAAWVSDGVLMIGTLESPHEASPDDWIIRGVAGELYPCKPAIFEATYEAAD